MRYMIYEDCPAGANIAHLSIANIVRRSVGARRFEMKSRLCRICQSSKWAESLY